MSDRRFDMDPAGGDQADRVFQVGLGANIGEKVAKTAFAPAVDLQLQGAAKPGNADDFAAGTNRFHGLVYGAMTGQALLGTAPGAFEDDVRADAAGKFENGGRRITLAGIERMVGAQLCRHGAGFGADIDGDDQTRPTDPGDL